MYQRLALVLKLRPNHRLDPNLDVSRVHFKIFKDVPKADVDMLLPGGRPRITRVDRAMILWPLLFGLGLLALPRQPAPSVVGPERPRQRGDAQRGGGLLRLRLSVDTTATAANGRRTSSSWSAASISRRWTATPAC